MSEIYWLASYPKSGNTWMRAFLANYLESEDEPADINNLRIGGIASSRDVFDVWVGVEASDLTSEEVERFRSLALQYAARASRKPVYMKIHDAFTVDDNQQPIIPPDVTAGVIYIIRNPLDVAVSFAHHNSTTIEKMVHNLSTDNFTLAKGIGHLDNQLPQKLLSWSSHVRSWVDDSGLDVHVVRYEDMLNSPDDTFRGVLQFIGQKIEPERLRQALEYSSFNSLKKQESEKGFVEKAPSAESFFRQGRSGGWRQVLKDEQADDIIEKNQDVMQRFGYLNDKNEPLF
jgi:aryl sulfotransferase